MKVISVVQQTRKMMMNRIKFLNFEFINYKNIFNQFLSIYSLYKSNLVYFDLFYDLKEQDHK